MRRPSTPPLTDGRGPHDLVRFFAGIAAAPALRQELGFCDGASERTVPLREPERRALADGAAARPEESLPRRAFTSSQSARCAALASRANLCRRSPPGALGVAFVAAAPWRPQLNDSAPHLPAIELVIGGFWRTTARVARSMFPRRARCVAPQPISSRCHRVGAAIQRAFVHPTSR